jgi:hypothetical protein
MAGQWRTLTKQPGFAAGLMLLLTDGTVMCQEDGTPAWWRLVPDATGQYLNGTWLRMADAPTAPLWCASAVLRDGRVFVAGGEYSAGVETDLATAAIYDPVVDNWTALPAPITWTSLGDAPCCGLQDGRVLVGSIESPHCVIFDPQTRAWIGAADKNNSSSSEETWTLLPDGSVLTANCVGHPQTQRYLPDKDAWIPCGNTVSDLVEDASSEIGPALLLPDGRCFAIGATGKTGFYKQPMQIDQPGTWSDGPELPKQGGLQLGAKDAPACLLPNGKVLLALGPVNGKKDDYLKPTFFYEFDPSAAAGNAFTPISDPGDTKIEAFNWRMLMVPTGEVLISNRFGQIKVYRPDGSGVAAGKPAITGYPTAKRDDGTYYAAVWRGATFTLKGTLFNGLSQAVSYGDDATMATNYPIVSLRRKGSSAVSYCRTFGHSWMGVATGDEIISTNFTVPWDLGAGTYELAVVVNGINSDSMDVEVN